MTDINDYVIINEDFYKDLNCNLQTYFNQFQYELIDIKNTITDMIYTAYNNDTFTDKSIFNMVSSL